MSNIRVLVTDRQELMREGIACRLRGEPGIEVVGVTGDGRESVRLVDRMRPTVLILDMLMPGLNGIDAAIQVARSSPETGVLCLSTSAASPALIRSALEAGVRGLIDKDSSFDELLIAIRALSDRRSYLSPALAGEALAASGIAGEVNAFALLTAKEREVVQLLSEGLSTKQVAARLGVSFKTVATHREHAMAKLGLKSVAELTRYAIRAGLTML